jgi:hypothetical protein
MSLTSRFHPGGLFRCCVQMIVDDDEPETIGRTLRCRWCDAPLVVVDEFGYPEWAWDREAEISLDCIRESIRGVSDDDDESMSRD